MAVLKLYPTSKRVKRDRDTFLRVLGECVSLWSFLDRELFNLTQAALGVDHARTAIVFYSWANIANHLTLVDRLMKHSLDKKDFETEWKPLSKSIKRHLDTRSIYAHQPVKRTGTERSKRAFYFYSIYIEPAEQSLQREYKGLGGKSELLAKDLRKHGRSLENLVKQVSEFYMIFKNIKPRV
jgi:hypothetical protein